MIILSSTFIHPSTSEFLIIFFILFKSFCFCRRNNPPRGLYVVWDPWHVQERVVNNNTFCIRTNRLTNRPSPTHPPTQHSCLLVCSVYTYVLWNDRNGICMNWLAKVWTLCHGPQEGTDGKTTSVESGHPSIHPSILTQKYLHNWTPFPFFVKYLQKIF